MLSKIISIYVKIIEIILELLMLILISAVTLQVLGRYIEFIPRYLWTIEVSNFCLIWIIFLGSILGVKESKHFFVDIFPDNISPKLNKLLNCIYYIAIYIISFIFIAYGNQYFMNGLRQCSPLSGLNLGTIHITILISGYSWIMLLTGNIYEDFIKKMHKEGSIK